MNKKYKILIVLGILIIITFTAGLTYSFFHTNSKMVSNNQNIAKLIFNTEQLDNLELPLVDMAPADTQNFKFAVKNTDKDKRSNVSMYYQITVKTYHFLPTIIKLYSISNDKETLELECNELTPRNTNNELICNTPVKTMSHSKDELHDYRIEVTYEEGFNDEIYKDLVDYINLEIKSWQVIN